VIKQLVGNTGCRVTAHDVITLIVHVQVTVQLMT